ncbi:hypothetical protein V6N12_007227 [Hibiscus sabdariffa]|uniref:Endonuclease/exonuclease/phosphatase domain-containing protein n=1 Tax=Hibiscus sabdariffa TaxID=183260 RepID=A0ABR2F158_9ROSI
MSRSGLHTNLVHLILTPLFSKKQKLSESQVFSRRFIALIEKLKNANIDYGFLNIYGPSIEAENAIFFSKILEFLANYRLPWCVYGDFNYYLYLDETFGRPTNISAMEAFRSFIQESHLVDLPLKGGSFTWSNLRDPPTLVCLDGFLLSIDFLASFHGLEHQLLSKSVSNHFAFDIFNEVWN